MDNKANAVLIPVTVIGGYLGAGKTTLLNHLLSTTSQRLAVLINDFGDINIDVDLIESHDGETLSLANGCICCSLVDGFSSALDTVLAVEPAPERIVVEASGVADPATVAAYTHGNGLRPDATIVVADAEQIRVRARDEYVGDTVLGQLRSAEVLVLNKADLVSAAELDACRQWLSDVTDGAAVVEATHAQVSEAVLFDTAIDTSSMSSRSMSSRSMSSRPTAPPVASSAHANDGPDHRSWTIRFDQPVSDDELEQAMAELEADVVRAKGMVWLTAAPHRRHLLQRVGQRWTVDDLGPWPAETEPTTEIVVIAAGASDSAGTDG